VLIWGRIKNKHKMKKTIITSLFVIGMMATSTAQQEVIERKEPVTISKNGMMSTSLKAFDYGEDGIAYVLYFRNAEYKTIVDIEYIQFNSKGDLLQFFDLCDSAVANKKDYITATYRVYKGIGKAVTVYNDKGDYFYPTLAAIAKMREDFINYDLAK
jgi:hypothetical protein